MKGETIYNWIMTRLDEGMTVYATTHIKSIQIKPKNRECVRLHGAHCEVQRGKHWDSINYCKITARN